MTTRSGAGDLGVGVAPGDKPRRPWMVPEGWAANLWKRKSKSCEKPCAGHLGEGGQVLHYGAKGPGERWALGR